MKLEDDQLKWSCPDSFYLGTGPTTCIYSSPNSLGTSSFFFFGLCITYSAPPVFPPVCEAELQTMAQPAGVPEQEADAGERGDCPALLRG